MEGVKGKTGGGEEEGRTRERLTVRN